MFATAFATWAVTRRTAGAGGPPEPLAVQGVESYSLLTLDGEAVLGQAGDAKWHLFPLAGGPPRPVTGLRADDQIWAWNREGTAVYVTEQNQVPMDFIRVDLATGRREAAFTLGPESVPGLGRLQFPGPVLDPGRGYAYGYQKTLSQIHVVHGARW